MLAVPESVNTPLLVQHHAVVASGAYLFYHVLAVAIFGQPYQSRLQQRLELVLPTFAVRAAPPRKQLVLVSQSKRVIAAGADLRDLYMGKGLNLLRAVNVAQVPVATLALVVRLPSAAPGEHAAM